MSASFVLASIGLLLALLVHGRARPATLFVLWAAVFHLGGLVDQRSFLASYTNPALVTLLLLLMVSLALERSPLLDRVSGSLTRGGERLAMLKLTSLATACSAFLNNTAVVGALLQVVVRQNRVSSSRLLIPLSYASILGGVITLVGTSTNLVVNSFAVDAGLPALRMFDFTAVGLPAAVVGLIVLVVGARLLPDRAGQKEDAGVAYFLEAQLATGSPLLGRSIEENRLRRLDGLFLVELIRGGRLISPVTPSEVLQEGDVLIFSGEVEKVQTLQRVPGLQVFGARTDALLRSNLVEAVISSDSDLRDRTLRDVDFRSMFDAAVVGIRRGSKRLTGQLGQIPLRVGDSLLLAVGRDFAQHRNVERNLHVLDKALTRPRLSARENVLAIGGFLAVIVSSAMGWVSLFSGLLVLLGLMLAGGLLSVAELRRRFPFELLLVIGSALVVARGIESSGAAALLASFMQAAFGGTGPFGALIGVYLLTLVMTELVTNNAAAALAFPVALTTARAFGVDPMPFVMVVAFGASACFMLPFGYQTHLMVYSPGRYRVADFIRVGLPVSIAYSVTVLTLVPLVFPFHPG